MPTPFQVKEIPISGVPNRCIVVPPRTGYILPVDLVNGHMNNATELWWGVTFDFEGASGGEIVAETLSYEDRMFFGLRSLTTTLPISFAPASSDSAEWFMGWGTQSSGSIKVAVYDGARRFSMASAGGPTAIVANVTGSPTVERFNSQEPYFDLDATSTPISAPSKVFRVVGRIAKSAGSWKAWGSNIANNFSVTSGTGAPGLSLEARLDYEFLRRETTWQASVSLNHAVNTTGGSAYAALSGGGSGVGVYVYNPFINNAIRVHAVVVKKYA